MEKLLVNILTYFSGHSDQVARVVFNHLDNIIISVANQDKSVFIWKIFYDK